MSGGRERILQVGSGGFFACDVVDVGFCNAETSFFGG